MNWFKRAKVNLQFSNFDNNGTFKVLANGKPYTFYGVEDKWDFKRRIENNPWEHGKIFNELRNSYSNPKLHKEINPDYSKKEKSQMLSEIPSQTELWGNDELV